MVDITYEESHKLIDVEYLKDNMNSLISLNEYIPSIIIGVLIKDFAPETHKKLKFSIRDTEGLNRFYIKQKALRQSFAHISLNGKRGTGILSLLVELLIFLEIHPQFRGVIKDEDYLDNLVSQCEKEYHIPVRVFTNDYEDMRVLLDILKKEDALKL